MAHFSWPLLYFLCSLPQLGLAGQLSMVSLSPAIARSIPTCAQACVESFITEDFPTDVCSQQDLGCLCTSNGASRLTLGEGSLRCVVSACQPKIDRAEETAAYYICQGIDNSKPMTHETITATLNSATAGSVPSSTLGTSPQPSETTQSRTDSSTSSSNTRNSSLSHSITHTASTETMNDTSPITITQTTLATSIPFLPQPISPSTLTSRSQSTSSGLIARSSSTAAAPVAAKPALTKPQIAGVAVAAVASAAAVVGFVFFIFYIRRRRSNGRDSVLSSSDKTHDSHLSSLGYHHVGRNVERSNRSRDFMRLDGQPGSVNPTIIEGSPASYWRSSILQQDAIGLAVGSPPTTQTDAVDEIPKSIKSQRTISQLLPDKPVYSLYPAPLRVNHPLSPESPVGAMVPGAAGIGQRSATPLSRPAPLGQSSSNISPSSLQTFYNQRPSASDPFLDSHSVSSGAAYSRQGRQNAGLKVAKSERPDPEVPLHGNWTQSLDSLHKPVPARQSSSARALSQQRAANRLNSPSDHTGGPAFNLSTQPPKQMFIPRKPVPRKPVPRRKSTFKRPATHYSSASETSFEDAGDEDEMPTARPFLPVAESPALRSSRNQATSLKPPISTYSQYGCFPEPESPTRKSARKRQPPPLVTSAPSTRPLKSILKPLPEVPEQDISDSATPLIAKRRGELAPPRIQTDLKKSPRGETELTKSAKWKILVSPGLQGIDNLGTPKSGRSSEWALNTPTRRDGR